MVMGYLFQLLERTCAIVVFATDFFSFAGVFGRN
jgi:hypothetical protein